MKIEGFVWYTDIVDKIETKHQVTEQEVESVFEAKPVFTKLEKGNVDGEDLYRALGQTDSGRYIAAFFIYKMTGEALIISARDMSTRERRYYAKRRK